MGDRRPSLALVAAMVLVAACGSSSTGSGPTTGASAATTGSAGGGATTGGGDATPVSGEGAPTTPGTATSGHPAGWDKFGEVSFEIGGPVPRSGELGFAPAGSRFGGAAATSLSFFAVENDEVLTIMLSGDQALANYGVSDLTLAAATCKTSELKVDATSATGSIDCSGGAAVNAAGDTLQGVTLKAIFTAHT